MLKSFLPMLKISKQEMVKKLEWLTQSLEIKLQLLKPSLKDKTLLLSKKVLLLLSEMVSKNTLKTLSLYNLISSEESLNKALILQ